MCLPYILFNSIITFNKIMLCFQMARALRKELLIMKTSPNLHHIKCYGEGQSHTDNTIWYLALEYMEMVSII